MQLFVYLCSEQVGKIDTQLTSTETKKIWGGTLLNALFSSGAETEENREKILEGMGI